MAKSISVGRIEFGGPATYRIVAQGTLPAYWRDRVGGMEIIDTTEGDNLAQVTLIGVIVDQAALRGIVETLYNLHMPIIRVERLQDLGDPRGGAT